MVEYLKTKKGYFYKLNKNGEKKRISQEEYNKHIIGGAGEKILADDIMYEDELVCILKPGVNKGVIVWSKYRQPPNMDTLCKLGLKTGKQLNEEGVFSRYYNRQQRHPYIFFRAPYYSEDIDYSTPEAQINSLYGELNKDPRVFIRVDPDKTFVFSSEIRIHAPSVNFDANGHIIYKQFTTREEFSTVIPRTNKKYEDLHDKYIYNELYKSKKTLSAYLNIIKKNATIPDTKHTAYNLYTSEKVDISRANYPYDREPVEKNSEILVAIQHLTPKYFVLCNKSVETEI